MGRLSEKAIEVRGLSAARRPMVGLIDSYHMDKGAERAGGSRRTFTRRVQRLRVMATPRRLLKNAPKQQARRKQMWYLANPAAKESVLKFRKSVFQQPARRTEKQNVCSI